jgi:hypothetical protein
VTGGNPALFAALATVERETGIEIKTTNITSFPPIRDEGLELLDMMYGTYSGRYDAKTGQPVTVPRGIAPTTQERAAEHAKANEAVNTRQVRRARERAMRKGREA